MSDLIADPRINESSWLVLSAKYPGHAYTGNDENGLIFVIRLSDLAVVGTIRLEGVTLIDPESADLAANGSIWLCDGGNNDGARSIFDLYVFAEPGPGDHVIRPERYRFICDEPKVNIEAFFIKPESGNRYVIDKNTGRLFRNDKGTLEQDTVGRFRLVGRGLPVGISEAKFTPDSKFVLARQKGYGETITVLDGEWFKPLPPFKVAKVAQPESLETDGQVVWFGSEGKKSPLLHAPLPEAYRTKTDGPDPDPDPEPSDQILELSKFKRTLPTGKKDHPTEVDPLKDTVGPVAFRAPVNGVTTSGSSYCRDELREKAGDALAKWSNKTEEHRLLVSCRVTEIPGKKAGSSYVPGVVFGQIHDADDDVVILLVNVNGEIVLEEGLGKGKGSKKTILFAGYQLGAPIQYLLDARDGVISVVVNGKPTTIKNKVITGAYFKAGCYLRGNAANATGAGEVLIDALEEEHAA